MEIKASCKFDLESFKALLRFNMFKKSNPKNRLIFWSVVYLVLILIVIAEMIILGFDKILAVLLAVAVLCWLYGAFIYFLLPKIDYNALGKMKGTVNEYVFLDEEIKLITKNPEYNGEATVKYSLIFKVAETSKYFFIYQTKGQVLLVDKATLVGGTAEDIRNKLMGFVGKKYMICNY